MDRNLENHLYKMEIHSLHHIFKVYEASTDGVVARQGILRSDGSSLLWDFRVTALV